MDQTIIDKLVAERDATRQARERAKEAKRPKHEVEYYNGVLDGMNTCIRAILNDQKKRS